jgi:hypothetical protein
MDTPSASAPVSYPAVMEKPESPPGRQNPYQAESRGAWTRMSAAQVGKLRDSSPEALGRRICRAPGAPILAAELSGDVIPLPRLLNR